MGQELAKDRRVDVSNGVKRRTNGFDGMTREDLIERIEYWLDRWAHAQYENDALRRKSRAHRLSIRQMNKKLELYALKAKAK